MITTTLRLDGYTLGELLYEGTRTLVYRGTRTADARPVVIKLLRNEYPTFRELLQFRNQYTIMLRIANANVKNLDLPGIVKPLTLLPYGNSFALVMEDFGGISLQSYRKTHALDLTKILRIAIQLAEILQGLYQNRVIHKDIKPANIIIHPETQQVKLIDFSIASLLPKENEEVKHPNILEGTLSYLAPEQTGRMNRGIDYRADFYALGITLFELLTETLPFPSANPLELVHCHIAKMPPSLKNRKEIPKVLSDIVMKLMAKNAEDRYQSALGLKHDLEICLDQLKTNGKIEAFEIGKRDVCDRFLIPEKLYGREAEVSQLLAAFDRVASSPETRFNQKGSKIQKQAEKEKTGNSEIFLVSGFSGIGKTAVVNEIHKPIVRKQGYFIKGKFDQFNRNIPFSAFVQAFRDLMGQLLSESETQLQTWKTWILEAVGQYGQVIIEVIPELERIIGQQPSAPDLSGTAAQNRFNLLFQKFIQVFTTLEHPLVIFLDDLQWADSASLNLIQILMAELETDYLLMIGAYRDNEIFAAHPLMLTLDAIRKAGTIVNTITLQPLTQKSLNALVADTLNCPEELAYSLTKLVKQKTKGNPFFFTQFLKALHQDQLITFDSQAGYWQCDIVRVREAALTNDVLEFMALQLQKLPLATQDILKLAACIGNQFDLATLAIVSEQPETEAATALWRALQEGLILPQSEVYKFYLSDSDGVTAPLFPLINCPLPVYKFAHDRIQQSAYNLIPESQKQSTHLKIGELLLSQYKPEKNTLFTADTEEKLFKIINHFNIGKDLIFHKKERYKLAYLNLKAGQKAKVSTAYVAAIEYFKMGIELLGAESWKEEYLLTLMLHEEGAEVAYLSGNFDQMELLLQIVLQQAKTLLDQVKVYEVKIKSYLAQNNVSLAIQTGIAILKLLNVEFPEKPNFSHLQKELEATQATLSIYSLEDLMNLPEMADSNQRAAMKILASIISAVHQAEPQLFPLMVLKQVNLSIEYGNAPTSSFAYAWYGILLSVIAGDIEASDQAGELALMLLAQFNNQELTAKVFNMVYAFIKIWKNHIRDVVKPLGEGYQVGFTTGDLEYAGYCAYNYCGFSYYAGQELTSLEQEMANYTDAIRQSQQKLALNFQTIYHQAVLNLQGKTQNPCCLSGEVYNEDEMLALFQSENNSTLLFQHYVTKEFLCYLFRDDHEAIKSAVLAEKYADPGTGWIVFPIHNFYRSLILLRQYPHCSISEQEKILSQVYSYQKNLKKWSNYSPMNYRHKLDLIEAEKNRILGQKKEAIEFYDRAIEEASKQGYIQEEALANELAAEFYLEWGKEKVAAGYLQEAYYCYSRWGSQAKTDDLEKRYSQLLHPIFQNPQNRFCFNENWDSRVHHFFNASQTLPTTYFSTNSLSDSLDFSTILKASQALSSEIQLEQLISTLVKIVMENTGADKCALILLKGESLVIEALSSLREEITNNQEIFQRSIPLESSLDVPISIVNYVYQVQETLVINDAIAKNNLASDTYVQRQKPKSLLCTPIINQGKFIGILYLENHLTKGVFTSDRLQVIKLLTAQAAISLENAQLYSQLEDYSYTLEQKVEKRTQALKEKATQLESTLQKLYATQAQLIQTEKMSSLGQLVAGIAHEINNPVSFIHGNLIHTNEYITSLIELMCLYTEFYPQPQPEIQAKIEEIDLEFIIDDLPKMLESMQTGTCRIRQIVQSLRNFSRLDESEIKPVDLHSGIDSTLLILQHRLKGNGDSPEIQVIKDYGQLPLVNCYASALNQVFMNLLSNGIDALRQAQDHETRLKKKLMLSIQTSVQDSQTVVLQIADNGLGIDPSVVNKIFEPFFTTKPVGKGTGLGLSISYSIIVEKHGGILSVNSTPGEGTEFLIKLPMQATSSRRIGG